MIGNRAPARSAGPQSAPDDAPPPHNSEVEAIKAKLDRLSPADVQAILSHAIRHLLDREAQRKLAKGLAEMVRKMDERARPRTYEATRLNFAYVPAPTQARHPNDAGIPPATPTQGED